MHVSALQLSYLSHSKWIYTFPYIVDINLFPPIASFTSLHGISIDTQVRESRTTSKRRKMISKERINWFCVWRICETCKKTEWIKEKRENKWKRKKLFTSGKKLCREANCVNREEFYVFLFLLTTMKRVFLPLSRVLCRLDDNEWVYSVSVLHRPGTLNRHSELRSVYSCNFITRWWVKGSSEVLAVKGERGIELEIKRSGTWKKLNIILCLVITLSKCRFCGVLSIKDPSSVFLCKTEKENN